MSFTRIHMRWGLPKALFFKCSEFIYSSLLVYLPVTAIARSGHTISHSIHWVQASRLTTSGNINPFELIWFEACSTFLGQNATHILQPCLLYTSPSPRD